MNAPGAPISPVAATSVGIAESSHYPDIGLARRGARNQAVPRKATA